MQWCSLACNKLESPLEKSRNPLQLSLTLLLNLDCIQSFANLISLLFKHKISPSLEYIFFIKMWWCPFVMQIAARAWFLCSGLPSSDGALGGANIFYIRQFIYRILHRFIFYIYRDYISRFRATFDFKKRKITVN